MRAGVDYLTFDGAPNRVGAGQPILEYRFAETAPAQN
jgi:hypothetical protein